MELKPSIITRLMDLDEMSSQGEVPKRGKVLSEKYFRKVAFIGVRERSQSPYHCSSVLKSPGRSDDNSALFSGMEKQKKDKLDRNLAEGENMNSNFVEICSAPANSFQFKASEIVLFKTWSGREENQKSRDFSSRCSSKKSRHTSIRSPQHDFKSEAIGQKLRVSPRDVENISRQMKFKSCPQLNFCSKDSSSLHKEATSQISESWKMVTDFKNLRQSCRGCWTLGEMLSMHDHGIGCPFLNKNPYEFVNKDRHGRSTNFRRYRRMTMKDRTSHSYRSQASGEVGLTKDSTAVTKEDLHQGRTLSGSKIDSQSSHSTGVESNSCTQEFEISIKMELSSNNDLPIQNASVIHKEVKRKKQQRIWDLSWAKTAAPYLSISTTNRIENTTKLDELIVNPEEAFVSSDCCSDTESSKSIIEACQHSPYSVLEPFQDSPSSSLGEDVSEMQFHPFSKLSPSSTIQKEKEDSGRVGKNQGFRYLRNVLTQSGFHGLTLIQAFSKWHSTECPINPLVFETLEKEYPEENSWKSERKILFDRINLRLFEIFQQYTGFFSSSKRVSTVMSSTLWYEVTEELIWNLLFRQEQEIKKTSPATVVEDDFELIDFAEYVDFIAREVENLLVDELAAGFLSW